jgi:formylglycine-generating enzyme required for sulfatase activity
MTKPETFSLTFSKTIELITFVNIPAGEFLMGSQKGDPDAYGDEMPQHEVKIPRFFMGTTPVTQEQWREVASLPQVSRHLNPNPSLFAGDNLPVEQVSWYDAMEFCARLSRASGRRITLPSEAQWEYVCRAGTTTAYAFGDTLTEEMANFKSGGTTPVGSFPANPWGLQDMHGNVWEWCLDDWHSSYEGAPTDGSAWAEEDDSLGKCSGGALGTTFPGTVARPTAPEATRTTASTSSVSASAAFVGDRLKVLRGGSWNFYPWFCRSAYRLRVHPASCDSNVGFRVCCLPQG